MPKLNKNSSVSLYQQLVDEIKMQIQTGQLKENDRLMTEVELSKEYDISRITVRKAIELLVEEDILVKRQGIGTFVAGKKMHRNNGGFMSFTKNCEIEGKKAGAILLAADLVDANGSDMKHLHIQEDCKVIRILRLRLCEDVPVLLEENRFPVKYAFLLSHDLTGSLYEILAQNGAVMSSGTKSMDICYANEEESRLLKVEKNKALLLMKDISSDQDGNPVHVCKSIADPDRYKITFELHSST